MKVEIQVTTKTTKLVVIVGCHGNADKDIPACPFLSSEETPGAGSADDYYCTAAKPKRGTKKRRMVDGYVEWPSEMRKPGDFPDFCPLYDNELELKSLARDNT